MREIEVGLITQKVREMVQTLNFHTPEPTMNQLIQVLELEPSPAGRQAMHDIVDNRRIASARQVPMCQDTGMAIIFIELGQEVHLAGGGASLNPTAIGITAAGRCAVCFKSHGAPHDSASARRRGRQPQYWFALPQTQPKTDPMKES